MHGQARLPAAHPHPARPRHPQAAVLDPQDRPLPSAALAAQMPEGNVTDAQKGSPVSNGEVRSIRSVPTYCLQSALRVAASQSSLVRIIHCRVYEPNGPVFFCQMVMA